MNTSDLEFDERCYIYGIKISAQNDFINLSILDDLKASEEILREDYKERIVDFVNSSEQWLPIARRRVVDEVGADDGLMLMTIFILFEQDENSSRFGLLFNLNQDREHGRGMVVDGDSFEILEYGEADVAFGG